MTFIHAADLHLDSPFKGLSNLPDAIFSDVLNSTFTALERLVDAAITHQVDFVLLAGDLFDNERQSLKAQIILRDAFEALKRHHIHVYLSYGNHDHINGNFHQLEYPDNVYSFPDEEVRTVTYLKNEKPIAAIYGFSYENQAVLTNKAKEYFVKDEAIPFHIAMLHGSVANDAEHDTYAPFQLSDLTENQMDYWALGHIHQRAVLKENPLIVYPGNTQGRHRKESGEKGCYVVTLTETESQLTFIPLQSILFTTETLDVSSCEDINQLETKLKSFLEQQLENSPKLLYLYLKSNQPQLKSWTEDLIIDDLIEVMNDRFTQQKNWLFIYKYENQIDALIESHNLSHNDHFMSELTDQMASADLSSYLKELYQHRQARKYLEKLSEEEQEKLKHDAHNLLVNHLHS